MLCYGSYSDMIRREVTDTVWLVMGVSGMIFAIIELLIGSLSPIQVFKSLLIASIFATLLYILNFGGADIKAIISLSILFPDFPCTPVTGIPLLDIPVLSVLINSLLIAISAPLFIFFYNLGKRNLSPLMFLGYRVEIPALRRLKNFKLMHEIEDTGEMKYVWGGIEPSEEILNRLEELARHKKIENVWVTPELPFIVYLTAGFITAIFYGDFISYLVLLFH